MSLLQQTQLFLLQRQLFHVIWGKITPPMETGCSYQGLQRPPQRVHTKIHVHNFLKYTQTFAIDRRGSTNKRKEEGSRGGSVWSHCMNASSAQTEIAPSESKQHISFIKKEEKIARVCLLSTKGDKAAKESNKRGPNARAANLCKCEANM